MVSLPEPPTMVSSPLVPLRLWPPAGAGGRIEARIIRRESARGAELRQQRGVEPHGIDAAGEVVDDDAHATTGSRPTEYEHIGARVSFQHVKAAARTAFQRVVARAAV